MAAEMVARSREEGLCAGVHIMSSGAEKAVPDILRQAGVGIG